MSDFLHDMMPESKAPLPRDNREPMELPLRREVQRVAVYLDPDDGDSVRVIAIPMIDGNRVEIENHGRWQRPIQVSVRGYMASVNTYGFSVETGMRWRLSDSNISGSVQVENG